MNMGALPYANQNNVCYIKGETYTHYVLENRVFSTHSILDSFDKCCLMAKAQWKVVWIDWMCGLLGYVDHLSAVCNTAEVVLCLCRWSSFAHSDQWGFGYKYPFGNYFFSNVGKNFTPFIMLLSCRQSILLLAGVHVKANYILCDLSWH